MWTGLDQQGTSNEQDQLPFDEVTSVRAQSNYEHGGAACAIACYTLHPALLADQKYRRSMMSGIGTRLYIFIAV